MRSPKDMQIIQIDVTNACPFTCSNCTRMCGHHAKNFMMDFETFQKAVDSLEGYRGSISMMGGEPTLHPEFEKFALYLKSKYPHLYEEGQDKELLRPMDDFNKTVQDVQIKYASYEETPQGVKEMIPAPCLFSMMGNTYLKHFEIIQDVFKKQQLNDHTSEMFHQPSLISRKDLGIGDEEWIGLRDKCWIQNTWSASVTPKGAFFCEIAGALDILFDGPGGWPIEKDWWKREPEDFADQLHWCELCGFPCETFTRNANDYIDDVSETLYEKLQTVQSPKMKSGRVKVIAVENGVITEESKASDFVYSSQDLNSGSPYIKYLSEKINQQAALLHPKELYGVFLFSKDCTEATMKAQIQGGQEQFTACSIFCETEVVYEMCCALDLVAKDMISCEEREGFGAWLSRVIEKIPITDYFFVMSQQVTVTPRFLEKFKEATINPGTLIYRDFPTGQEEVSGDFLHVTGKGFVGIFNGKASALAKKEKETLMACGDFSQWASLWTEEKRVSLDENLFVYSSKYGIQEGDRCAIFGAGGRSTDLYFRIKERKGQCVAIVDSDEKKHGNVIEALTVASPDHLKNLHQELDKILLGSPIYYQEMEEKLSSMGIPPEKIIKL